MSKWAKPSASVLPYLTDKGAGAAALVIGDPDLGAELAPPWAEREARMVGQREKGATGLGKLSRGDEVVGLQPAFLDAGTLAVVTTLWQVDDKATFELIRAFSTRMENTGPVEALRQAQLETMASFPHPYQWATFSLTGVPR